VHGICFAKSQHAVVTALKYLDTHTSF
jgi:hypothetical protein